MQAYNTQRIDITIDRI